VASIIGGATFGSKIVLLPKWNVEEALALVEKERVTGLGGVPTMVRQILDFPKLLDYDLSSLRSFPMGGAHVPPDLPLRVVDIFGKGAQILNGYGLTETTSAVVLNVGAEYAARPDSVGRPNLTADIRVEDAAGNLLNAGEIGELCFRSPQVVTGYWNNPAATNASFVEGWFHSGDLGYVDSDGYVHVVDRMKDVVIRGGENVYCAEVESVLFTFPAVADAAVVGVPDDLMGERVCAVVVLRPGEEIDLVSLRARCQTRLAAFKCPEVLHVIDEIPKNATGKTAKHELRRAVAGLADQ
jgi:acyl-CoA synthetase (AMP-forming)/AMP-acid ligase II